MFLFFLAISIVILYYYRSKLKTIAKRMNTRGVEIPLLINFEKQYPTYYKNVKMYLDKFNKRYQDTFDYKNVCVDLINDLFSMRDDILYNISEIRLRLPNDLTLEKNITAAYEQADRRLMEYITDVKSRFNINVYPGQTSSSFAARSYRAYDDIVS